MLENLSEDRLEAASQAEGVGEKILSALSLPYDLNGQDYRSSASIGLTQAEHGLRGIRLCFCAGPRIAGGSGEMDRLSEIQLHRRP